MEPASEANITGAEPASPVLARHVLAPEALRLLASLDDGFAPEDSVGRPLAQLSSTEMQLLDAMIARRLCRMRPGWDETWWASLTPIGRALLPATVLVRLG